RLPSDSTSRWTPLPWAIAFPLLGWLGDLHPLGNAHAERTAYSGDTSKAVCRRFFLRGIASKVEAHTTGITEGAKRETGNS
ncbi:MAG: hypothetical protein ACI350_04200, partial [Prevotella sp.]